MEQAALRDDQNVDELRSAVTIRMAKAQANLNAHATRFLKWHSSLTLVEWRIIQLLSNNGASSMSALAAELIMDKGQLSRRINAMIDKGLITSEQDQHDQRRNILHLTGQSIAYARELKPVMEERQSKLLAGIGDMDLKVFLRVLAKLDENASKREVA